MNIRIRKVRAEEPGGCPVDGENTYIVTEDDREFRIVSARRRHNHSLSLDGDTGILYIDGDDGTVHRQTVELGGGCGLIITDERVKGLSPWAIRGISLAERRPGYEDFFITAETSGNGVGSPVVLNNGLASPFSRPVD